MESRDFGKYTCAVIIRSDERNATLSLKEAGNAPPISELKVAILGIAGKCKLSISKFLLIQ